MFELDLVRGSAGGRDFDHVERRAGLRLWKDAEDRTDGAQGNAAASGVDAGLREADARPDEERIRPLGFLHLNRS
jgi:hypothetical protein